MANLGEKPYGLVEYCHAQFAGMIYIWQNTVKGSVFHLILPKIVVNDIALHFCFFGLSLKIQSRSFLHVYWSPKIP